MTIAELLKQGQEIWGGENSDAIGLVETIAAMGVVYGDICRWSRDRTWRNRHQIQRTGSPDFQDLEKELGNLIFSTIRWCDELGFDPERCIKLAIQCQREFVSKRGKG